MLLRYLRDPHLAFWALAVLALATITVVAANMGSARLEAGAEGPHPVVPGARVSHSTADVQKLVTLLPAVASTGTDPAAIRDFASTVHGIAANGAQIRAGEGAAQNDALLSGFIRVVDISKSLWEQADAPVAAASLKSRLGLAIGSLHSAALGLPTPGVPKGATNPLKGGSPELPTAPIPSPPQMGQSIPDVDTPTLERN